MPMLSCIYGDKMIIDSCTCIRNRKKKEKDGEKSDICLCVYVFGWGMRCRIEGGNTDRVLRSLVWGNLGISVYLILVHNSGLWVELIVVVAVD